jgi:hypothetical protein
MTVVSERDVGEVMQRGELKMVQMEGGIAVTAGGGRNLGVVNRFPSVAIGAQTVFEAKTTIEASICASTPCCCLKTATECHERQSDKDLANSWERPSTCGRALDSSQSHGQRPETNHAYRERSFLCDRQPASSALFLERW